MDLIIRYLCLPTGEFKPTLLCTFIASARLRQWISRPNIPPAIKSCAVLFNHLFGGEARYFGGIENDLEDLEFDAAVETSSQETKVSCPYIINFARKVAHPLQSSVARVRHRGIMYSRSSTHMGNSHILFYSEGNKDSEPVPGTIVDHFRKSGCLYITRETPTGAAFWFSRSVSSVHLTSQRGFILRSWSLRIDSVKLDWIASHFACYPWSDSQTAVLSLSRVRVFIINPLFLVLTSWQDVVTNYNKCTDTQHARDKWPLKGRTSLNHWARSGRRMGEEWAYIWTTTAFKI